MKRGSLRINFQLNSIHQFRQCTFRLQQFFNILISSDFAHILTLSFPMDVVYNGENRLSIFFIFEKLGSKYWRHSKKALILSSESANMLIRGVVKFPVAIKFMGKKGEYQDFLSKHFCLRVLKNFVGEHFSVS